MANLLSRPPEPMPFAELDPERLAHTAVRLQTIADSQRALEDSGRRAEQGLIGLLDRVEASLDEIEADASLPALEGLLEEIDEARRSESGSPSPDECRKVSSSQSGPGGALVCYWPGRSLETAESNLESRGFYDARDRPPLGLWLTAIARSRGPRGGAFELVVLAWVPPADIDRARAGRAACASRSLAWLDETSEVLAEQLSPLLRGE